MESFEEDREKIHQLIGLPYLKEGDFNDSNNKTESKLSTKDWTKLLFENVTQETKEKIKDIFKHDFEMYSYDKNMY